MPKTASVLRIKCPVCGQAVSAFEEVLFIEGYFVKVEFTHCGRDLESSELNILSLFPDGKKEERMH